MVKWSRETLLLTVVQSVDQGRRRDTGLRRLDVATTRLDVYEGFRLLKLLRRAELRVVISTSFWRVGIVNEL